MKGRIRRGTVKESVKIDPKRINTKREKILCSFLEAQKSLKVNKKSHRRIRIS